MALYTGQVLQNRYDVIQLIGQGGMATVYLGADTRLGNRHVAIKEMNPANLPSSEQQWAITAFQQEAQVLARLDHPVIARVIDFFQEGTFWYLVMEYVAGEALDMALHRFPRGLAEEQLLNWASQLGSALDYLHQQHPPIIFRDLKPANVMVQPDGTLKLIDFGIARYFKPGQTHDTVRLGTAGYAAPEQYGRGQTDARSDVFSLGVLLHELLTGYDPTRTPLNLPPIRSFRPDVSKRVVQAIEQATRPDPSQRYASVRDFAADLGISISGFLVPPYQPALRPSRLRAAATLLLLFFIVGGGIAFCTNINPTPTSRSETPVSLPQEISLETVARLKEFAQVEGGLSTTWISSLDTDLLGIGYSKGIQIYTVPDMESVSFLTSTAPSVIAYNNTRLLIGEPYGGIKLLDYPNINLVAQFRLRDKAFVDLAFYQQAEGFVAAAFNRLTFVTLAPATRVTSFSTQATDIEFSPDYRWLAVAGLDSTIQLWDRESQVMARALIDHKTVVTTVAFSPDGAFLISGDQYGNLYKWNMQNYSLEDVVRGHQGAISSIDISMDSQIIASSGEDGVVRFGSASDLNLLRILRFPLTKIEKVEFSSNGYWLVLLGNDHVVRLIGVP